MLYYGLLLICCEIDHCSPGEYWVSKKNSRQISVLAPHTRKFGTYKIPLVAGTSPEHLFFFLSKTLIFKIIFIQVNIQELFNVL